MTGPLTRGARPLLSLRDIHKRYGALEVLKGVSIAAEDGDVVSIVGASGSGKSTLLRCIPFLETPDAGTVALDDETVRLGMGGGSIDKRQVTRLRKKIGFVFQSFNLFPHMTVLGNVIEAPVHVQKRPRAECIAEAEALLEKVGLAAKRDSYPAHLSGGQQQRAAIARAMAMRPRILLFDEPTSALDPELVGEVLRVMRGLAAEGRTMLIVTHEMGFARDVSTRAVFLHNGRVDEEGPPEQVFGDPVSERCRRFVMRHLDRAG